MRPTHTLLSVVMASLALGQVSPTILAAGLATDDSHDDFGRGGASPGRGWVMVRPHS